MSEEQNEELMAAYKNWLAVQAANDLRDYQLGKPPLPRSRSEALAIYYSLPSRERKRYAKIYELP